MFKYQRLVCTTLSVVMLTAWHSISAIQVNAEQDVVKAGIKNFVAVADTYTVNNSTDKEKSYGTAQTMYVRTPQYSDQERRGFIKFDFTEFPQSQIKTATLNIRTKPLLENENAFGDTNILIYPVSDNEWDETTLKWTDGLGDTTDMEPIASFYYGLPEIPEGELEGVKGGDGDQWVKVDLTQYLQNITEQADKRVSFVLKTENQTLNRCYLYTKESNYAPYIEMVYITEHEEQFSGSKRYEVDADTYVVNNGGDVNTNYGSYQSLYVYTSSSGEQARTGFMRFSCLDIVGQMVDSAVIYIKSRPQLVNDYLQNDSDIVFTEVKDKTWDEKTITWNNQPTELGEEVGRFFYEQVEDTWYALDVTDYLNSQPDKIMSFALTTANTSNRSRCYFYSGDAANTDDRPYLIVNYGFKKMSEFEYTFTDAGGKKSPTLVEGGNAQVDITVRSSYINAGDAFVVSGLYNTNGRLIKAACGTFPLEPGEKVTATCTLTDLPAFTDDEMYIKSFLYENSSLQPLVDVNRYWQEKRIVPRNGRINMVEPYYRDTISDDIVKLKLYAPSIDTLKIETVKLQDKTDPKSAYSHVFAQDVQPGPDGYTEVDFNASEYPFGPISIVITGYRTLGGKTPVEPVKQYVQLYNEKGEHYSYGMPDIPPAAEGMQLAFFDDFTEMPTISQFGEDADGNITTYSAHTPFNSDYGSARFENFEGEFNPYKQRDSFLTIESRAPEGYADANPTGKSAYGGLLSTIHPGKNRTPGGIGQAWTYGYFECRMFFPPGYGCWPSFWLMSRNRMDDPKPEFTSEVDIVEGYMYEPHKPRVNYPRWNLKDISQSTAKKPPEWFNMTENGMVDMAQWFHTYAAKITDEYVYVYLNDVEIARLETDEETKGEMFLMMNLALGAGGGGVVDLSEYGFGADLYIDYVRVYVPTEPEPEPDPEPEPEPEQE